MTTPAELVSDVEVFIGGLKTVSSDTKLETTVPDTTLPVDPQQTPSHSDDQSATPSEKQKQTTPTVEENVTYKFELVDEGGYVLEHHEINDKNLTDAERAFRTYLHKKEVNATWKYFEDSQTFMAFVKPKVEETATYTLKVVGGENETITLEDSTVSEAERFFKNYAYDKKMDATWKYENGVFEATLTETPKVTVPEIAIEGEKKVEPSTPQAEPKATETFDTNVSPPDTHNTKPKASDSVETYINEVHDDTMLLMHYGLENWMLGILN
ncbi:hypothetical protein [Streptococcus sp. X13SY08]|nr:hypothetical protein [Streptococcus sp. X13SY08]